MAEKLLVVGWPFVPIYDDLRENYRRLDVCGLKCEAKSSFTIRASVASKKSDYNGIAMNPIVNFEETIECVIVGTLAEFADRQVTILLGKPVSADLTARLLRHPAVFGIIRGMTEDDDLWGGAAFVGRDGPRQIAPSPLPTVLLAVLRGGLGIRAGVRFIRRGVRRCIVIDPFLRVQRNDRLLWHFFREVLVILRHRLASSKMIRSQSVPRRLFEKFDGKWALGLARTPTAYRGNNSGGPIILLSGSLGPGGSERQLVLTAIGIKRRVSREVKILCQSRITGANGFFAHRVREHGIAVKGDIGANFYGDRGSHEEEFRALSRLNPAFAELVCGYIYEFLTVRPSVVHAWLDEPNIAAGLAAVMSGVPRIILGCRSLPPYNFGFYESYMRSAYRALLQLANVTLISNSRAGARDYAAWLGIRPERIPVIHNGFDFLSMRSVESEEVAAFRAGLCMGEGPVVVMVGRISEEKRPYLWLDVARQVLNHRPDANFLWVGDGPLRAAVRQRAHKMGISTRFFTPGLMQDVSAALATASVFLLTSRVEGLPNVVIEAQHYGAAVVTADVGGASEALAPGAVGVALGGSDPTAFAAAVLKLLNDPKALKQARRDGPRLVERTFSADSMVEKVVALYANAEQRCSNGS